MKTKTLGIGLVAGAAIGAAAGIMIDSKRKSNKHHGHHTFRSLGTMIDGVISAM